MTFTTVGILPATTARRTEHVTLGSAYLVHFLAALGTVIVSVILGAWGDLHQPASVGAVVDEMLDMLDSVVRLVTRYPVEGTLVVIACVVGSEVGYVLGALLCSPWGAIDEALRSSIRNAVRRAWLHTPHAALVLLLVGGTGVYVVQAQDQVWRKFWDLPIHVGDYEASRISYEREMSRQPFYVRHGEETAAVLGFAGGAWWLWSLLRFIGAPRPRSSIARPPTCENCGYNLTGIGLDGRCPECGESAVLSLGPDVRAATPWQRHRPLGWWNALRHCSAEARRRPTWFGRQLPLSAQQGDHRWLLAACLPALFCIGWAGVIGCYIADTGHWPRAHDWEVFWMLGPIVGYFAAVSGVVFGLLAAGLVGLAYRVKTGRNLLAGAMQAACYSAGYIVLWSIAAFVFGATVFLTEDYFRQSGMPSFQSGLLLFVVFILLPNFLGFAGYVGLIARITSGTRFANR